MRSAGLFAVLAVVLALSSAENAFAIQIEMHPTCGQPPQFKLDGQTTTGFIVTGVSGEWTISTHTWGSGWENLDGICGGMTVLVCTIANLGVTGGVTFTFTDEISSASATWTVDCPAVGGVVMPANTLALVSPWLAVLGFVGCIGTAVVIAKKRP